jgi:cysteine desulfurase
MGYAPGKAASGLRLSLGPWLSVSDLALVPAALERARRKLLAD